MLGALDDPGVDTTLIIRKHRIPDTHDPAAVAEAGRLGDVVKRADLRRRTDFRSLLTVTIDGETARDFDDAISLEPLPNGHHRLGVHIADVAHYVQEGSALDLTAYTRGTSVYFPERALHMFPAPLATGLCSLNPGVDRLVQSCLMEIDRRGAVARYELHDGVIRSDVRMTYTAVDAILTRHDADTRRRHAAVVPLCELMETVYRRLHARRVRRGSIDFDLKATQLVLDEAGLVGGHRGGRSQRRASHHRGVHAGGQRDGRPDIWRTAFCRRSFAFTGSRTRSRWQTSMPLRAPSDTAWERRRTVCGPNTSSNC